MVLVLAFQITLPQHAAQAAEKAAAQPKPPVVTRQEGPLPLIENAAAASVANIREIETEAIAAGLIFEPKVARNLQITATAYSSTPDQTDDSPFLTASGTYTRHGVVASNYFKIGTKLRFPELYGDQIFVVEDRMNERYHRRLDIWMPTREAAKQFGVAWLKIEVIE